MTIKSLQLQVEESAWLSAVHNAEKELIRCCAIFRGGFDGEHKSHSYKTHEEYANAVIAAMEERASLLMAALDKLDSCEKAQSRNLYIEGVWKEEVKRRDNDLMQVCTSIQGCGHHRDLGRSKTALDFAKTNAYYINEALKKLAVARTELKKVIDKIAYPHLNNDYESPCG